MLFTWDTTNLCIVFRQWHVRSFASLVFSLLAVVGLAMGYEALRSYSRHYEACHKDRIDVLPSESPPPRHVQQLPLPATRLHPRPHASHPHPCLPACLTPPL